MASHKAVVEIIRGSASLFLLLCIASTVGLLLLILLFISFAISWIKKQLNQLGD